MAIKIVTPENLSYFKTKQDAANETKFALKGHKHNAADINSGVLAIANGGTGASTPAAASEALSKFKYAVQLTNENLNDYATGQLGTYYAADGNTCTNKPSGVDGFGMMVIRSNTGHATQILYCNGTQYIRNYDGSAWGTWSNNSDVIKLNGPTSARLEQQGDENKQGIKLIAYGEMNRMFVGADTYAGMWDIDNSQWTWRQDFGNTGILPVSAGGTGATNAAGSRANLSVPSYGSGISSLNFYSDVPNGYNFVADARTGSGEGYYSYFGNSFLGLRRYTNNGSWQEDVWMLRPNDAIGGVFVSGRSAIHDLSRDTLYNLAPGTYLVYNDATNGPESGNYGNLLVGYCSGNRIVGLLAYDNGHVYTAYGASSSATFGWKRIDAIGSGYDTLWTGSVGSGGTISLSLAALQQYRVVGVMTSYASTFAVPALVYNNGSGVRVYGVGGYCADNGDLLLQYFALRQSGSSLVAYARSQEVYGGAVGGRKIMNITGILGVV